MEGGPSGGQDQPDPAEAGPAGAADTGVTDPLTAEAMELRRLVDAGAGSPEELRALAARLRAHRQQEEARWRAEVKPQLLKQGRGRLRRQPPPPLPPPLPPRYGPAPHDPPEPLPHPPRYGPAPPDPPATEPSPPGADPAPRAGGWPPPAAPPAPPLAGPEPGARALWTGLGLLAMVGVAVLASRTTGWVLVLPVVGLLGWAWSQGRDARRDRRPAD